MTIDLDAIQEENARWVERNFPGNNDSNTAFTGMVEELGELAHARLKAQQGIREIAEDAEYDALGDLSIYLLHYCSTKGLRLSDIIQSVWHKVRQRDWVKYPKDGLRE